MGKKKFETNKVVDNQQGVIHFSKRLECLFKKAKVVSSQSSLIVSPADQRKESNNTKAILQYSSETREKSDEFKNPSTESSSLPPQSHDNSHVFNLFDHKGYYSFEDSFLGQDYWNELMASYEPFTYSPINFVPDFYDGGELVIDEGRPSRQYHCNDLVADAEEGVKISTYAMELCSQEDMLKEFEKEKLFDP